MRKSILIPLQYIAKIILCEVLYLEQVHNDSCEIDVADYHYVEMSEELQFSQVDSCFAICV
jgi:hypothetical protein